MSFSFHRETVWSHAAVSSQVWYNKWDMVSPGGSFCNSDINNGAFQGLWVVWAATQAGEKHTVHS